MSERRIAELEAANEWLRQELDRFRGPLMNEVYANLADVESRLAEAQAALEDIQQERSHGATANSEYIDRRIAEGLEGHA